MKYEKPIKELFQIRKAVFRNFLLVALHGEMIAVKFTQRETDRRKKVVAEANARIGRMLHYCCFNEFPDENGGRGFADNRRTFLPE